jgi:predicted nucleic acid-binding protein
LIDTNIILDDILNRVPNAETARKVSQLATDEVIAAYLTANCLTDIFYVVSKYRDESVARKTIRNLLLFFSIVGIDGQDCRKAIDLPMGDFEDALVAVCAEKAALDYIVTNDKGFLGFVGLTIPAISPADFILKLASRET